MVVVSIVIIVIVVGVVLLYKQESKRIDGIHEGTHEITEGVVDRVERPIERGDGSSFWIKYEVNGSQYVQHAGMDRAAGLEKDTEPGTKVLVHYRPEQPGDFYCVPKQ